MEEPLILLVDLEATCWEDKVDGLDRRQTVDDMEIIEFGCVLAKMNGDIVDAKSYMVRPQIHPKLTDFCTRLTTITQTDVEAAPYYLEVVTQIDYWLAPYKIKAWGSWGQYDKNQIEAERRRHNRSPSFNYFPHLNLKKLWRNGNGTGRRGGLKGALGFHGLEFEGTQHRGIDDALNISKLLPHIDVETALNEVSKTRENT